MNNYGVVDRILPVCEACDMAFSGELHEKLCPACRDESAALRSLAHGHHTTCSGSEALLFGLMFFSAIIVWFWVV